MGRYQSKEDKNMIVEECAHGYYAAPQPLSVRALIANIREGLPFAEFTQLQKLLLVPMEKLAYYIGLPKTTLNRRKAAGRLAPDESERVVRLARLMGKAIETLKTEENARHWLTSPARGLGGAIPLEFATTEVGAREVENLLGRIEHGVFS